jgi:5-methylcytosine-specific restriction endonuclease McrBC regulatory subunit McrC
VMAAIPDGLDLKMKKIKKTKKIKNINQTDLFEMLEQLEQLKKVESELNMTSSLGLLELNTIVEKQVDWVDLALFG